MIASATWHGRRGPVLLGPTEHRVASWLRDMTRNGRVRIRTTDLAIACRLERSEAYRITRRLRVLGLFGVENDRGGTKGGRAYWRTAIEHDAAGLNHERHRAAWSRIVAWARQRRAAWASVRRPGPNHQPAVPRRRQAAGAAPVADPPLAATGATFGERMRAYGLGPLMDEWGVT